MWCDDTLVTRTARILVGNIRTYAPLISFTPLASPVDGCLDVCTFAEPSPLELLKWFVAVLKQRHLTYDGNCYTRGERIQIAGEGIACHVDGEHIGQAPLTLTVRPRSVPIVVPIAHSNVPHLMLREDVVEALKAGQFPEGTVNARSSGVCEGLWSA